MDKKTLLIVFGGCSSEYEVSLRSAASVIRSTNRERFEVLPLGITKSGEWFLYSGNVDSIENGEWIADSDNLKKAILSPDRKTHGLLISNKDQTFFEKRIDLVFGVLHGKFGEDGTIQGLFEMANIPYVGPNVIASANCMDKVFSRIIYDAANLPQAKWFFLTKPEYEATEFSEILHKLNSSFPYPVFVKPANAGSSVGISKVSSDKELKGALELAFLHDKKILIEEGLDAREIEISVLGNNESITSVCGEIISCNDFYDYEAKYVSESKLVIPAELPAKVVSEIECIAKKAYKALNCEGLSRIDFLIRRSDNKVFLNEINTIPGFTSISMYPKLFEKKGVPYQKLLDTLYDLAILRTEDL